MGVQKYYVVWKGRRLGVFDQRDITKASVGGFAGAEYKSFPSKQEAVQAFAKSYQDYKGVDTSGNALSPTERARYGKPDPHAICVDAACSGNPGDLEYRGVDLATGSVLFHRGPYPDATTNIGEFLALVEGAKILYKSKQAKTLYSDSRIAIWRLAKGTCRTQLTKSKKNAKIFEEIKLAEEWLAAHPLDSIVVKKRHTKAWGEIPADFGRK